MKGYTIRTRPTHGRVRARLSVPVYLDEVQQPKSQPQLLPIDHYEKMVETLSNNKMKRLAASLYQCLFPTVKSWKEAKKMYEKFFEALTDPKLTKGGKVKNDKGDKSRFMAFGKMAWNKSGFHSPSDEELEEIKEPSTMEDVNK